MSDLLKRLENLSPEKRELMLKKLQTQTKISSNDTVRKFTAIQPISRDKAIPLSFAQQRLWFLEQLQPDNSAYNITSAVRVLGSLNITALEASLNEIIKRHEALRTTFMAVEGLPMQVISANLQLSVPIIDLQAVSKSEQETQLQQIINQETKQPFDLQQLPLLRVAVIKLSSTEYVVIFTMHHIISDAWSMSVIIREIIALYPAFADGKYVALPELPIQYADVSPGRRPVRSCESWSRRPLRRESQRETP